MRIIIYCVTMLALAVPCRAFELSAVVVSVYDGDTLTVDIPDVPPVFGDDVGVRVLGIDTPEMRGGTPETRRMAVQARDQVRCWCPGGSMVILRDVARDKYFRVLARVECGGVDVGSALLGLGLARPYDGGTKGGW